MVLRIMDIIKKCQSRKFCGIAVWFEPFLEDMNISGALVQGKRQSIAVGSKVNQKTRDKDVVITKNVHPAIVSEEEYEIAKATIAFMKKPDYRGARKFALKGKVRCGNCRRSMVLMESGANDRV